MMNTYLTQFLDKKLERFFAILSTFRLFFLTQRLLIQNLRYLRIFLLLFTPASLFSIPWLSTKDQHIVDSKGNTVRLCGVNLGCWLAEEMWLMPFETTPPKKSYFTPIKDRTDFWQTLEARFSSQTIEEIRSAFRNTWITEQDFARIRKMGFNTVRIPFLYDLMEEQAGLFTWIDRAVEYAKKYDLYIILDMHGAPGRQSDAQHTGCQNRNKLFSNEFHIEKTATLWQQIAKRYKNCSQIAGYDLLNEPKGAKKRKTLYKVYDTLYKAIRKEDTTHLIFIEDGYKGIRSFPEPQKMGWKQVVYSRHIYSFKKEPLIMTWELLEKIQAVRLEKKTPFFIGEFNAAPHGSLKMLAQLLQAFQEKELPFTFWNYKTAKKAHSLWGIYNAPKKLPMLNPFTDSPKDLLRKIKAYNTTYFIENKPLVQMFKEVLPR